MMAADSGDGDGCIRNLPGENLAKWGDPASDHPAMCNLKRLRKNNASDQMRFH